MSVWDMGGAAVAGFFAHGYLAYLMNSRERERVAATGGALEHHLMGVLAVCATTFCVVRLCTVRP